MHKDKLTIEEQTVQRPDFIPADKEYLYPGVGSIFCDFVPEGKTAEDVHGQTYDGTYSNLSTEPIPETSKKK